MNRSVFQQGSVAAFFAVALGALGAHGAEPHFVEGGAAWWSTAALYHFFHALGILIVALAAPSLREGCAERVRSLFLIGILLFSGSLYLMALTGITQLGIVTPIGGLAFLWGWASLAWGCRKQT